MKWRYLDTGFRPASFNMEFDEFLARQLQENAIAPTLRVYGWKPHAISIGRHQLMEAFDVKALKAKGIDIVRRPTGGRAVLHADELTYSVVAPFPQSGLRELYRTISMALIRGLHHLGINAQLSGHDADFRNIYADPASVACFSSSARSEIQFNGKKLIGSAQRRYGSVVLQHGSLLLGPLHRAIADYLSPEFSTRENEIREELAETTIDARTILGRDLEFAEAAAAIRAGFSESLTIDFFEEESEDVPEDNLSLK